MPEFGGRIKCIYIDPPYNTGNENWAYNDNVNDPKIKKWLNKVVGSDDLSRHDKWLCMMYPRLRLLHELLSKDGVIFISIDDNEIANLKLLCDEIFGERKFLGCISWLKGNAQNDADNFQKNHEYILCYTKNSANIISQIEQKVKVKVFYDEKNKKYFREGAGLTTGGAGGTLNARPNLGFSIYYNPKTKDFLGVDDYDKELAKISNDEAEVYSDDINLKNQGYVIIRPPKKGVGLGRWTWALDKFNNEKENILIKENNGKFSVVKKEWLKDKQVKKNEDGELYAIIDKFSPPKSFIDFVGSGFGTRELKQIFNGKVFDYPKPSLLIEYLLQISTDKNSIILDSFAGSGTTAHAVLELNKKDGGKRKFILIEMNDYANSTTAERVKRVIKGYGDKPNLTATGGSFEYFEIGEKLLLENGNLNEKVATEKIKEYIYFSETGQKLNSQNENYLLGFCENTAYYFIYEKDKSTSLNLEFLSNLVKAENYVIYADNHTLGENQISKYKIKFKKIPRDIAKI